MGSDVNGKCYFNKYTNACSNDKPEGKPACSEITNPKACTMNCFYNKETSTCAEKTKAPTAPIIPCAERTRCIGQDADGKCYKNKYTGGCVSGKPTKPEGCEGLTE